MPIVVGDNIFYENNKVDSTNSDSTTIDSTTIDLKKCVMKFFGRKEELRALKKIANLIRFQIGSDHRAKTLKTRVLTDLVVFR